ncbi:MAG TPA: serine protease [Verrucomicrobiae bacterium]|nr:serine protease [Verrucomicrobiae bacterium]
MLCPFKWPDRWKLSFALVIAFAGGPAMGASAETGFHSAPAAKRPAAPMAARPLAAPRPIDHPLPSRSRVLPALDETFKRMLEQQDMSQPGRRLRIGLGRALNQPLLLDSNSVPSIEWTREPDGTVAWSAAISATGALGIRLHVENIRLPRGAKVSIFAPGSPEQACALKPSPGEDAWAMTVSGDTAIIECRVPSLTAAAQVHLSVAELSHMYRSFKESLPDISCIPGVACYPAWLDTAAGVALIEFVDKGDSYVCTGCLVNDNDPSTFIDYFLTANHCIPNRTVAETLEVNWFYQADSCDGVPSEGIWTSDGASLLATSKVTDFSLLRLNQPAPDGATFAGWTTSPPDSGEILTCIQHPAEGDKRISFGTQIESDPAYWGVQWMTGVTENGSSGSPLLNANHEIIGQLIGGFSSCADTTGEDGFGRFDGTYPHVSHWLDNGPFISKQGSYSGLFFESNSIAFEASGSIALKLTDRGSCSGSIQNAGKRYSFSGKFRTDGSLSVSIHRRGALPMILNLALDLTLDAAPKLTGTLVSPGNWAASVRAEQRASKGSVLSPAYAGSWDLLVPGTAGDPLVPAGDGCASVTVSSAGGLKFTGSLPDGTAIAQSLGISAQGDWPLYISLYGGKGCLLGWMSFSDDPASAPAGVVTWIKKPQTARTYATGFTNSVETIGTRYFKPAHGASPIALNEGMVLFLDSNDDPITTNFVTISSSGKIKNLGPNRLIMSIAPANGILNGSITLPGASGAARFQGVVLQGSKSGDGYWLLNGTGGRMLITTP